MRSSGDLGDAEKNMIDLDPVPADPGPDPEEVYQGRASEPLKLRHLFWGALLPSSPTQTRRHAIINQGKHQCHPH